MPPRITLSNLFSYGFSFHWLFNLALSPDFKLANVAHRVDALGGGAMGLIDYVTGQFDRTVTWDDAEGLAEQWAGPFVIKGLQSVDGGICRGTQVLKSLALGADACSIGWPYLYGLAAGGQAGVERALELLRAETERSMALLGVSAVADLGSAHVRRVGDPNAYSFESTSK